MIPLKIIDTSFNPEPIQDIIGACLILLAMIVVSYKLFLFFFPSKSKSINTEDPLDSPIILSSYSESSELNLGAKCILWIISLIILIIPFQYFLTLQSFYTLLNIG